LHLAFFFFPFEGALDITKGRQSFITYIFRGGKILIFQRRVATDSSFIFILSLSLLVQNEPREKEGRKGNPPTTPLPHLHWPFREELERGRKEEGSLKGSFLAGGLLQADWGWIARFVRKRKCQSLTATWNTRGGIYALFFFSFFSASRPGSLRGLIIGGDFWVFLIACCL